MGITELKPGTRRTKKDVIIKPSLNIGIPELEPKTSRENSFKIMVKPNYANRSSSSTSSQGSESRSPKHIPKKNKALQEKWLDILRIPKSSYKSSGNRFVCSKHFKDTDLLCSRNRTLLKKPVVPSINLDFFEPQRFPKDKALVEQWLNILNIPKSTYTFSDNRYVCSRHFKYEDMLIGREKVLLKKLRLPTVNLENLFSEPEKIGSPEMTCQVPTCKNVRRFLPPGSDVRFFRFPRDEKLQNIYKEKIGVPNFVYSQNKYICSDHFLENDYVRYETGISKLKVSAVPSLKLPAPRMVIQTFLPKIKTLTTEAESDPLLSDTESDCLPSDTESETLPPDNQPETYEDIGSYCIIADKRGVALDHTYFVSNTKKVLSDEKIVKKLSDRTLGLCRICFNDSKERVLVMKPIINMITTCVPFMGSLVRQTNFLCLECLQKLQTAYTFHHACLQAKKIILAQKRNQEIITINCENLENDENVFKVGNIKTEDNCLKDLLCESPLIFDNNLLNDEIDEVDNFDDSEVNMDKDNNEDTQMVNNVNDVIIIDDSDVTTTEDMIDISEIKIDPEEDEHVNNDIEVFLEETNEKILLEPSQELSIRKRMSKLGKRRIQCPKCGQKCFIGQFVSSHLKNCKIPAKISNMLIGCKHCNLAMHRADLMGHFKKLHQPHQCKICKTFYRNISLLRDHMKEDHKIIIRREVSNQTLIERRIKRNITRNRRLAEKKKQNVPNLPNNQSKPELTTVNTGITRSITVCHICGKSLLTKGLKRHLECHSNKTITCKLCNLTMKEISLQNHMKQKHGPKRFVCDQCGKAFAKYDNMLKHQQIHNKGNSDNFKCDQCNVVKNSRNALYNHIIRRHRFHYKCDNCGRTFVIKENYEKHIEKACTSSKGSPAVNKCIYACHICDKVCKNKYNFRFHLECHALGPTKCKICGKKFKHERFLSEHMKYHDKQFICDFCGIASSGKWNLIRHKKIHADPEKPHGCMVCWAKFSTLEELNEHVKIHNNKKYKCKICGEAYNRHYLLKNHINFVHGTVIKSDEDC